MGSAEDAIAAVTGGDVARLRELLEKAPGLANTFTDDGWSLLHLVPNRQIATMLLDHGANVNVKNRQKLIGPENRPLHAAAYLGRHDVAEVLLERGAEVDARDRAGFAPLHLAAANGHVAIVKLLLTSGAEPNPRTTADVQTAPAGTTPLALASQHDRLGDDGMPVGAERLREVEALLRRHGAVV
jgi:ankyrin repeat protein